VARRPVAGRLRPVAAILYPAGVLLDEREWLEADGLGGFASGTVSGVRTRRYHALLLTATTPPTGRMVLVNGFEAWVDLGPTRVDLSTQRYLPDVLSPEGYTRLESFARAPWPTWRWQLAEGLTLAQELFVPRGTARVAVRWKLSGHAASATLTVRPLLSGRDYHALHHENPAFTFAPRGTGGDLEWHPYEGVPGIRSRSNGRYVHRPEWYRQFFYSVEQARGLDAVEDLASPGAISWDLTVGEAVWLLEAVPRTGRRDRGAVVDLVEDCARLERTRRAAFPTRLEASADQYLVARSAGQTIVAGYPWFTDWGRDTFIALRGLCLSTGRLADARDILLAWAETVSQGMLPNRFPDAGAEPEFNSVDASLWFVLAVQDLLQASARRRVVRPADRDRLLRAVDDILRGYAGGTRFGIHVDHDGLVAAGVPGMQLTWMDARVGDYVVTPRIGKPVEIQALWLNALAFAGRTATDWRRYFDLGLASFQQKFWNASRGCLYDVIDVDHVNGQVDGQLRPNQIFAVAGLPVMLVDPTQARQIVDLVERELLTPVGLRTLGRGEAGYEGSCSGDPSARDHAYHQGTVWPWLMGAFVEAWVRVRGSTAEAKAEARTRFVEPLLGELDRRGLGHLYEIADAEPPFTPGGCPFQAWSVGELLRALRQTEPG
jgi:predicted glycogen debranching enzyme